MTELMYGLPFDPKINEINISQGRNGPWGHTLPEVGGGGDRTNAIDFKLLLGTRVVAMKEGKVFALKDWSDEYYRGSDPRIGLNLRQTNFVVIVHKDGSFAFYGQLAKNGVFVKFGEAVRKGQVLAETGLSGWNWDDNPHLHVQVNQDGRSLPIRFEGYSGPLEHDEIYPPSVGPEGQLALRK